MSATIDWSPAQRPTDQQAQAGKSTADAPKPVRSWIVAGLYPLAAFVVVPLVDRWVSSGTGTNAVGAAVPWNGSMFVLLTTLLAATVSDLRQRRIRNSLTYTAFLWLVALSAMATLAGPIDPAAPSLSWFERSLVGILPLAETLSGAAVCFGIMFFVFLLAGAGGGDVKLCMVIGAALGVEQGLTAVVASHIAAGAAVLSWVVVVHGPLRTFSTLGRTVGSLLLPLWISPPKRDDAGWMKFPLPMSPFFLLGTLFTLWMRS